MSETATTVLGEDLTQGDKPEQTAAPTQTEEFLSKYVGDGKKYKSVEDLAKAYANAEGFIETLKTEKQTLQQEMETKLSQAKTVEDIMAALTKPADDPVTPDKQVTGSLTAEDLEKAVEATLTKRQQMELIKANQTKAWTKLDEAFGNHEAAKKAMADYIGNDPNKKDLVDRMGSYTPDDLIKLIVPNKQTVNFSEPGDTVPDDVVINAGELSWSDVQKIKKTNPTLFRSREFQKKLHKLSAEGKLK